MSLVFGQVSDWDIVLAVGLGLRVLTEHDDVLRILV